MATSRSADLHPPACFSPLKSHWTLLARALLCRQGLTTFVRHMERQQEPHRRQETRFQRRFRAKINVKSTHFGGIFGIFFALLATAAGSRSVRLAHGCVYLMGNVKISGWKLAGIIREPLGPSGGENLGRAWTP